MKTSFESWVQETLRPALISMNQPLLALFMIALVGFVGGLLHTFFAGWAATWELMANAGALVPWAFVASLLKDIVFAFVALDDLVDESHHRFGIARNGLWTSISCLLWARLVHYPGCKCMYMSQE
jgi:hypothetical protein